MALMTGEQYIESIRKIPMEIYMFGKKVENPVDNPILRPSLNSVRMTYDLAQMPEYQELMTAISPETGERINRFTHIHRSTEDLRNKVKMQRLLGQKTAACFQRCVGMDAFNAEYSTTYEIDKKYGTSYHENFKKFMLYCQENDLTVDGAMTDVKGDRSKAPHAQDDPDMFLHVVERRPDGVVVCGAKAHQTGIINSHEVIVMPTQSMGPDDKDYAISFAVPLDTKGLFMIIGRQSCDTRKLEGSEMDVGNSEFGGVEALTVFDHVFVPNDRIFMNGETEYAGMLVERFAGYHRQSYGGCKVGVGDVLIGAAAVAAVAGMDAGGQAVGAVCHRPERVCALLGAGAEHVLTPEDVALLLASPQGGRKGVREAMAFRCVLNKADTPERSAHASAVAGRLAERGIHSAITYYREEERGGLCWF